MAIQLWLLPSLVFDGLAVAGQGLVGDCVGRQRVSRARKVARYLLRYGLGIGMALGLGYAALGRLTPFLKIFTRDPTILAKVPEQPQPQPQEGEQARGGGRGG